MKVSIGLVVLAVAACGGSAKPVDKPVVGNNMEMGEEEVEGNPNADETARQHAIQEARDAGILAEKPADPAASGDLDKASIRAAIRARIQEITFCYEKQLLAKPDIAGTTTVNFFIEPTGVVSASSGAGFDPDVDACVADVVKTTTFPKPSGGGGVQVSYPFKFKPLPEATGTAPAPTP